MNETCPHCSGDMQEDPTTGEYFCQHCRRVWRREVRGERASGSESWFLVGFVPGAF